MTVRTLPCRVCGANLIRVGGSKSISHAHCLLPGAQRAEGCWMDQDAEIAELVIRSLTSGPCARGMPIEERTERTELVRQVLPAVMKGGLHLQTFLIALGERRRFLLLESVTPKLRIRLATAVAGMDETVSPPQRAVAIPSSLPAGLKEGLATFHEKLSRRLDLLVRNGHRRSEDYLQRVMTDPLRLAEFSAASGLTRWSELTSSTLIQYSKAFPQHHPRKLTRFMAHIRSEDRFRKNTGSRNKKKPVKLMRSTKLPDIYQPQQLATKLREARRRLQPKEYVLYWMVARLGMTAKAALSLTLDGLHVNERGELVIRPSRGWINVPTSIAGTLRNLAQAADPRWPHAEPETGRGIPFLAPISTLVRLTVNICQREAKKLRLSAAYAAIRAGHHDRSTLKEFMGISLPILEQLEFFMAADLHSVVDPDIVQARNDVILGKADA